MENTVHLESPVVGGEGGLLRSTCHMLSESGLKQKPSKSKQDGQPDPPWNGGGEIQGFVCVWVRVCVFSKWGDGRRGNLFVGECGNWLIIDDLGLSNAVAKFTSGWCLCPSTLCWWPFPSHSLTLSGGWGRGSLPWDSSQLKAAPHPWGVGKRMERHFKGRLTADVKQCRRRSRGAGLQNGTCWAETHGGGGSWNVD